MRYEYKTEHSTFPDDIELVEFEMKAGYWELITVTPVVNGVDGLYCYWFRRDA